jgi:hypothetical protein
MENLYFTPLGEVPQTELYSTPLGGAPQELPPYWRFEDGTIRTDLPKLSNAELAELGWIGPIQTPIKRQVKFKKDLEEEELQYYELFNDQYEYNQENESWSLKGWDYDPEINKAIWSTKKRAYVFLGLGEDETLVDYEPPLLWDKFKMSLFKSEKFNKYVLDLSIKYPVISTALSIEIKNLTEGFNQEFINIWEYAKECFPLSEDVILELTKISNYCNLTEENLNFLIKENKEDVN